MNARAWLMAARRAWWPSLLMVAGAALAVALTPRIDQSEPPVDLAALVPQTVGAWQVQPGNVLLASLDANGDGDKSTEQPYDQTLMRTFGAEGRSVMLALAYTRVQAQEVKTHRPEVCYPAQGFRILQRQGVLIPGVARGTGAVGVPGVHMLAQQRGRLEAVAFWVRTGGTFTDSGLQARMELVREGLQGRTSDGVLVRASMLINDPAEAPQAFEQLDRFLQGLVAEAPPALRHVLVR